MSTRPVRRALVSVYDKSGLDELAQGLADAGVEIVSTGSTAARIAGLGIEVTQVADVIFPVAVVTEKSGTFLNWEGRPRPFSQVFRDALTMTATFSIDPISPDISQLTKSIDWVVSQLG